MRRRMCVCVCVHRHMRAFIQTNVATAPLKTDAPIYAQTYPDLPDVDAEMVRFGAVDAGMDVLLLRS